MMRTTRTKGLLEALSLAVASALAITTAMGCAVEADSDDATDAADVATDAKETGWYDRDPYHEAPCEEVREIEGVPTVIPVPCVDDEIDKGRPPGKAAYAGEDRIYVERFDADAPSPEVAPTPVEGD